MEISEDEEDYSKLRQYRNRKDRKAGGWQSIGLDQPVFKGIEKKGFKQPTPIQRKAIPCILDGKDVVAMSRTGSGKTAAFVIPLLQHLKKRDTKGTRALLISPTRELALQTFKVVKELGRFTGLRSACLVGGDSIEDQFAALHENPDLLIATPGRLLHIVVEMNLRLNCVQFVVFDEADRLFEMGFLEQLNEILKRLPENRQTLLFSATLPKSLVDFAKAGLSDPILVRLDVDEKVSEKLSMVFALCRPDEKIAAVLSLGRKARDEKRQTVIFCATMKHVEYLVATFNRAGIQNAFVYSQLDSTARKLNIKKFREKEVYLLIVTDVAARGVDIPLLDTAINMHFPPKPKLFVHRVGRVARNGRSGTAISLVTAEDLPYLTDLFLFLGRPIQFAKETDVYDEKVALIGKFPPSSLSLETDFLQSIHDNNDEMQELQKKSENAMLKYTRTREPPSAESAARVKGGIREEAGRAAYHPYLRQKRDLQSSDILNRIANFKTNATVFEVHTNSKSAPAAIMKEARRVHGEKIRERREQKLKEAALKANQQPAPNQNAEENDLLDAFPNMIWKKGTGKKQSKKEEREGEKQLHFISYAAADATAEKGLGVDFCRHADKAAVEMAADDEKGLYKQQNKRKWDRKLKKFVGEANDEPAKKKMRTEDGTWLPVTYKTGRYEMWQTKQKLGYGRNDEEEEEETGNGKGKERGAPGCIGSKRGKNRKDKGGAKNEIRSGEQILKKRKQKEKIQSFQEHRRKENLKKRGGGNKGSKGSKGFKGKKGPRKGGKAK